MSDETYENVRRLFHEALNHPPEDRAKFVAKSCDDERIRALVQSLIAHDQELVSSVLLGVDGVSLGSDTRSVAAETVVGRPTPKTIGRYIILETLGAGGMGVVYLAEQEEPVRRRVALKLIKVGMETRGGGSF